MLKEHEKYLFAGWLQGQHLSDMDKFTSSDFPGFSSVFNAIKKCGVSNLFDISKQAGVPITNISEISALYSTTMYASAHSQVCGDKLQQELANSLGKSPAEIRAILDRYDDNTFSALPEPNQNLCEAYLVDFGDRPNIEIINTGINYLDDMLCGIRRKELTSIAARPSTGKSAFMLQVSLNVAEQNKKVLYFPLEMDVIQTTERAMLSKVEDGYNVPYYRLRKGNLQREEWQMVQTALDKVYKIEQNKTFLLFEGVNDIDTIVNLIKVHRPYLVVIDQLEQLNSKKSFKDKREKFSYMTNTLKRISMAENVGIWLACQLNRTGAETPSLSHIKESGSIEEDSDNVILLHREKDDDEKINAIESWDEVTRPISINLLKHRCGATGNILSKFIANRYKFIGLGHL